MDDEEYHRKTREMSVKALTLIERHIQSCDIKSNALLLISLGILAGVVTIIAQLVK